MVENLYLWFRHSLGFEMPLHKFQTVYLPKKFPKKKDRKEETRWFNSCAADFEQGKRPTPPLPRVMAAKVRELRPGSTEDNWQKKAIQEIKECLDSTITLAENAKIAYEKARLEIVEAESQVAILTRKFEDALNAQKIASEVLEAANGKNRQLRDEALGSFSNYFSIVGQQEVISVLRQEHPDFDHSSLEAKFPPMDIEDPLESSTYALFF
ncbi:hypothetical protein Adt_33473 [Abeliophyllum distichum]|uniref:Uncharacterized protein n=1 Tax=Abeliophyllum distichum TaxID=126358 RepID=A0ABD1QWB7_9LAMI